MKAIRITSLIGLVAFLTLPLSLVFSSPGYGNSLQQRIPQQQKQLLETLPEKSESNKAGALPKFGEPKSEAQHHQQAQILYRYLRKVRGLDHDAAMEELKEADFPTSRIGAF